MLKEERFSTRELWFWTAFVFILSLILGIIEGWIIFILWPSIWP